MSTHTSYRENLNKLPDVFSVSELKRYLNLSDTTARVYLSRWSERGLVESWAPRSGIYFNLVSNKNSPQDSFSKAVNKCYPQSILIGPQIIRAVGWITQISNTYTLALNVRPTRGSTLKGSGYPEPKGVSFEYRNRLWWHAVLANRKDMDVKSLNQFGFQAVSPGFALVDMWKNRKNEWFPDPDDLYLDDYSGSLEDIQKSCVLLNVDFNKFCSDLDLDYQVQGSLDLSL